MKHLIATLILALSFLSLLASAAHGSQTINGPAVGRYSGLSLELWTDRADGSRYHGSGQVEIYFRAADDCYLTLYNIESDGSVHVLFPRYPDNGFIHGGATYRLPEYSDHYGQTARRPRGTQYIHAVATKRPGAFRFRTRQGVYGLRYKSVHGDPFIAIRNINARLLHRSYIHATATTSFFVRSRPYRPYRQSCGLNCACGYSNYHPVVLRHRSHASVKQKPHKTKTVKRHKRRHEHTSFAEADARRSRSSKSNDKSIRTTPSRTERNSKPRSYGQSRSYGRSR